MELNDKEVKASLERLLKLRREWFPVRDKAAQLETVARKEFETFQKLLGQKGKNGKPSKV